MVWVPSAFTSTHLVVAEVGDEDVAAPVHRHARGLKGPEPIVVWVPSAFSSTTCLVPISVTKTSPDPSAVTPKGRSSGADSGLGAVGLHLHHATVFRNRR